MRALLLGALTFLTLVCAATPIFSDSFLRRRAFPRIAHKFGSRHADVHWVQHKVASESRRLDSDTARTLKIFHVTDSHVSLVDEDPPLTSRMYNAFLQTTDRLTQEPTTTRDAFVNVLRKACAEKADLIALGGDIVNFPSNRTVSWVLEQLDGPGCGIPFVYTAGNHDWHEEGVASDAHYDSSRVPQLASSLRPLFDRSIAASGTSSSRLFGHVPLKGVDVYFFDNSNHQLNQEQLDYARKQLERSSKGPPALLLLHMPLALPGLDLAPKFTSGDPTWGAATDENCAVEARPCWPEEGNLPSTRAFIELVQAQAAPAGRVVALLTGHVHRDFNADLEETDELRARALIAVKQSVLACDERRRGCSFQAQDASALQARVEDADMGEGAAQLSHQAEGAVQYTTLDGAEGGYRLLRLHLQGPAMEWT